MPQTITKPTDQVTSAVVGEEGNTRHVLGSAKIWRVGIGGLVVVVILVGASWKFYDYRKSQRVSASDVTTVQNKAAVAVKGSNGGVAGGLKVYNNAITNATDSATQASLDMQAADLAANNNMLDTALSYALKADAILHNDTTSSLVANIYQQQGNSTQAVNYYKKAAAEVKPDQEGGSGKQYYLAKADEAATGAKE
jgi:hypothetical protein